MKPLACLPLGSILVLVIWSQLSVSAAVAQKQPQLIGIASIDNRVRALVTPEPRGPDVFFLEANQSRTDYRLNSVNEGTGEIALEDLKSKKTWTLSLGKPSTKLALNFPEISTDHLVELYQHLAGRTVIRAPQLIGGNFELRAPAPMSNAEAIEAIKKAFSTKGIVLRDQADRFAFAVGPRDGDRLGDLPLPPPVEANPQQLAPGTIRFFNAEVEQVLMVYSMLAGRFLLEDSRVPNAKVTLRSQTPMSRSEAQWCLENALHLAGVRVISAGDPFAYVVPAGTQTDHLPRFKPAAAEPNQQPPGALGNMRLVNADVPQLLKLYGEFTGRSLAPLPSLPAMHVSFSPFKAMSKAESIFALEALLRVHGMKFVTLPGDTIEQVTVEMVKPKQ